MKLKAFCLSATLCALSSQAFAQASDPAWSASVSGSWSQVDSSDRESSSASASLSRTLGEGSVGFALATSSGSDALFEQTEITDRSSVFASAWIVLPVGPADLDLSVSYGQEDFEGRIVVENNRFEGLNGAEIDLTSQVDSFAVAAALSQVFVEGNWDFIPSANLGWSQSEATSTADAIAALADLGIVTETQEGMTASLGLGLGYLAHDQVYLFSDVSGLYAENGASVSVGQAARTGGLRSSGRQSPEEASWAEVSLGVSFYATDTLTLTLSGGTTAGREQEEVFASTSVSIAF